MSNLAGGAELRAIFVVMFVALYTRRGPKVVTPKSVMAISFGVQICQPKYPKANRFKIGRLVLPIRNF